MTTVRLPVALPPPAYCYQFYAFPLAIIGTAPASRDWLRSNFVQLAFDRAEDTPVRLCFYLYDYAVNPWLETVRTTREWLEQVHGRDILAFLRGQLAAGYYPYLNVDEFHLPGRRPYGQFHRSHDILVHGFDAVAATYDVLGFDNRGSFTSHAIPAANLAAAYEAHRTMDAPCQQVYCYRLAEGASYPLDRHLVRRTLEEYRTGYNTSLHHASERTPWNRAYGLNIYEPLADRLRSYMAGHAPYDVRDTHVLWEHKRLMVDRARMLTGVESPRARDLVRAAETLASQANSLRLAVVKHELAPAQSRLADRVEALPAMRDADEQFCTELIRLLDDELEQATTDQHEQASQHRRKAP